MVRSFSSFFTRITLPTGAVRCSTRYFLLPEVLGISSAKPVSLLLEKPPEVLGAEVISVLVEAVAELGAAVAGLDDVEVVLAAGRLLLVGLVVDWVLDEAGVFVLPPEGTDSPAVGTDSLAEGTVSPTVGMVTALWVARPTLMDWPTLRLFERSAFHWISSSIELPYCLASKNRLSPDLTVCAIHSPG